jgi:trk system potassium uptake protein TrkH
MNQRILANLGFLLQTAGLLTIIPIAVGFVFNETQQLISLFVTAVTFLGAGFLLNALCERKDLNVKSASTLLFLAFLILPLIGAIPYLYFDPFNSANPTDLFTNSYFESVSGFATNGLTFISNPDALPQSILVYRSLTEVMGGVGVVFLVLAFFQSKRALPKLGGVLGIENLNRNLKRMFFMVLAIYGIYIVVFTAVFYLLGYHNLVATGAFVIDTLTGGFSPNPLQVQQYLSFGPQVFIIVLMFLGSVNFAFNYHLLTGKIKKAVSLEIVLFIAIIAAASIALFFAANIGFMDSLFHVVSMASTQGVYYLNISAFNPSAISILITLMAIGGCAFSMAGGIKVSRLLTLGTSFGQLVKTSFTKSAASKKKRAREDFSEAFPAVASILLFIAVLVVFALLFSTIGVSFEEALFEVGSALSTTGATMGAITVAMPVAYKWLIIAAMIIGKVEILTVIVVLFPLTVKKLKRKTLA